MKAINYVCSGKLPGKILYYLSLFEGLTEQELLEETAGKRISVKSALSRLIEKGFIALYEGKYYFKNQPNINLSTFKK